MGKHTSINHLITRSVPLARADSTVKEVEDILRVPHNNFKTINYVYVLDETKRLIGVFSLRELFQLEPEEKIGHYMQTNVMSVTPKRSAEFVAQYAIKHGLKAVPVITEEGIFVGVMPYDSILETLNQEHTKDVLQLAGVTPYEDESIHDVLHSNSPLHHVRLRLPWLIVGLGGGLLAAMLVGAFEETLAEELVLAAFIPAIVYMADAVGSQTQMLFVRSLSTKHDLVIKKQLKRESLVNCLLGLILGGLVFLVSWFWFADLVLSLIVGLSIFLTVWLTVVIALLLPWALHLRGYDPAVASGPLATVLNDLLSIFIYLLIATFLLSL
jgi:magnesium transporter